MEVNMTGERKSVESVERLEEVIASVREAQRKYATYTQEQPSSRRGIPLP